MRQIVKFFLTIFTKLFYRVKVYNKDLFIMDGPTIIMPNHVSFMDPFFLAPFLPKDTYFVIHSHYAKKFRFLLKFVNHISIDPLNPYSLKSLLPVIKKGCPVVIFPEGRLTETGSLMKIYSGVGLLAARTGATIYPVVLDGLEFSKLSRVSDKYKTRMFPKVKIYFDRPFKFEKENKKKFKSQKEQLRDKIYDTLQNAKLNLKRQDKGNDSLFYKLSAASKLYGANKIIVKDTSGEISYKKAIISSYVLGNKLSKVLENEEVVGVLLPNSIGHFVALFGLFYGGKTPAILNFSAGSANNIDCCQTSGVKTIITSRKFIEKAKLEDYVARLAGQLRLIYLEDIGGTITLSDKLQGVVKYYTNAQSKGDKGKRIILFTSGSESKPKGVVLKHSNIIANINQLSCAVGFTPKDSMLNALPMFHSFGLTAGTLLPVLNGVGVYLYPSPLHYKIIPEVAYSNSITIMIGTPTFLMGYAKSAHHFDFNSLRLVISGGEKLKDEVKYAWLEKFGIKILEGYGTTEASPVLSVNTPLYNSTGTVGKILPGIEWRLEKVDGIENGGNLMVRGENIMEGYLLADKGFMPTPEWYNTGDVVEVSKDGFVTIKSRLKRFAKISGEMISLDAVEKIAENCFCNAQFAAVSKAHPKKGEVVVLYSTDPTVSKSLIREYLLKTGQSMLMLPNEVVYIEKIPLLGSGKFDYVMLSKAS